MIHNPFFVKYSPCILSTIPFLLNTRLVYDLKSLFCLVLPLYTIYNPFFVKYSPCIRSTIPFLLSTRLACIRSTIPFLLNTYPVYDPQSLSLSSIHLVRSQTPLQAAMTNLPTGRKMGFKTLFFYLFRAENFIIGYI